MMKTTLDQIKKAFDNDGYDVYDFSKDHNFDNIHKKNKDVTVLAGGGIQFKGRTGVMAIHREQNVQFGNTLRQKKAFYVEGNHYEMGFLIGVMAEQDVYRMANQFLDNIIPAFISKKTDPDKHKTIKKLISDLLEVTSIELILKSKDIPKQYLDETKGLYDGCAAYKKSIGGGAKAALYTRLLALNLGIDIILSHVYTGEIFRKLLIKADELNVPIMCNAFSIKGESVQNDQHFFGRDFMFSTADVFQDVACMIIYNADDDNAIPIVSQSAPGFFGSVTAMNLNGVAAGTDMNPASMCNPERPGFNSLGLVRDSVQYGGTMQQYIDRIKNTQRGVTWFYPGADGQSGQACFIEAGMSTGAMPFPYFDYIDEPYKTALQSLNLTEAYITDKQNKYGNNPPENGMIARNAQYNYPVDYMTDFNKTLFDTYNKQHSDKPKKQVPPYDPAKFAELGYIDATTNDTSSNNYPGTDENNCPAAYYFAPQREQSDDLIIVTNSNISPEMRLTAMNDWIALLAGASVNDIQWRYDELNEELLGAMNDAKSHGVLIDVTKARQIIDFRAPGSPGYTVKFPKNGWQTIEINGSVSLCELKSKMITSHYGYYGDPWVTISLPNYFV